MTYGRIRCIGTPHELRTKYGGGNILQCTYTITNRYTTTATAATTTTTASGGVVSDTVVVDAGDVILRELQLVFPASSLEQRYPGFLSLLIPSSSSSSSSSSAAAASTASNGGIIGISISGIFAMMQQHATRIGITDWEVGQVGLDAVFQRVVHQYRAGEADDDE